MRSALAVAGFELELVLDWVGKIDADGEITAEADEYPVEPLGAAWGDAPAEDGDDDGWDDPWEDERRDGRR